LLAYRRSTAPKTNPSRRAKARHNIKAIQASLTQRVSANRALAQRLIKQKQPVETYQVLPRVVAFSPEAIGCSQRGPGRL